MVESRLVDGWDPWLTGSSVRSAAPQEDLMVMPEDLMVSACESDISGLAVEKSRLVDGWDPWLDRGPATGSSILSAAPQDDRMVRPLDEIRGWSSSDNGWPTGNWFLESKPTPTGCRTMWVTRIGRTPSHHRDQGDGHGSSRLRCSARAHPDPTGQAQKFVVPCARQ